MIETAILGFGTVGSGVAEVIDRNQKQIQRDLPEGLHVKYILDLRDFPDSPYADRVVHDINVILDDPEVRIVCETMGGKEPAFTFSKQCLERGKSVCTSNKELVD
ncbi:MAG TPA: homoserine dehydrogenase, partial [Lachnospiraceae bacterium]|nr:homoserine dehydrogenase [Lachnospiraceae bacterium]